MIKKFNKNYPIVIWSISALLLIVSSFLLFFSFYSWPNNLIIGYLFYVWIIVLTSFLLMVNIFALHSELKSFDITKSKKILLFFLPPLLKKEKLQLKDNNLLDKKLTWKEVKSQSMKKNNWIISWIIYPWFFASLISSITGTLMMLSINIKDFYGSLMLSFTIIWSMLNGFFLFLLIIMMILFFVKNWANQVNEKYPLSKKNLAILFPFAVYPSLYKWKE
ncbi:hypothetical protein NV226_00450 [Mycoplasma iguanae]|uniref:Uncharacterized protein n=1 Tax=Mycoplasma iguanae TaxID=292461 RepID=A0ABY5R8Y4_9MOLU|nr:hypothetical protein [Mycoplasma iguanae]UVD81776.1 hypothetical protein NV226_00450 [Mycoplasma iguanae]